ncbi:MAG: hypothetical protein KKB77_08190 [Bacteroidetes bacterium]|nr:hypothetical protein [Bacteroidota bacterium]
MGYYGTILRTTNGGASWTIQSSGTTDSLRGVCFTDANTGTAVRAWGTIVRNTNGGDSWQTAKEKLLDLQDAPVPDPKMGGMRITLADSLIFALKSSKLSDEGENKIIEISRVLVGFYKSNPSFRSMMRFKVGGHTDRIGGDR